METETRQDANEVPEQVATFVHATFDAVTNSEAMVEYHCTRTFQISPRRKSPSWRQNVSINKPHGDRHVPGLVGEGEMFEISSQRSFSTESVATCSFSTLSRALSTR